MKSIKNTNLYSQVIKELNYSFADIFILDGGVVISEIKSGVVFSWDDHAQLIIEDVVECIGANRLDLVYISNRINNYSVMATDWLKFYKNNNTLKGYYVVGVQKSSYINLAFENLFFNSNIKKFNSLEDAIETAKSSNLELASF